jgi:RNA polymerase sigma factor (sigma-70 family)
MTSTHERPARRRDLLRAACRGERNARERLVVAHLDMVRRVASGYRDLGVPYDDLVQEGLLGLLDAVDRYDPSRGVTFETFASFRVRSAVRNALTDQARLVRLPKHVVERRRLLESLEARLTAATGHTPTAAELAAASGLPVAVVLEAQAVPIQPASLDALVGSSGSPGETLISDAASPDPERKTLEAEDSRLLREAVDRLSPRQREIITRHFGLEGEVAAVAAVASDLHLSERRTRTIEQEALRRLEDDLRSALGRAA